MNEFDRPVSQPPVPETPGPLPRQPEVVPDRPFVRPHQDGGLADKLTTELPVPEFVPTRPFSRPAAPVAARHQQPEEEPRPVEGRRSGDDKAPSDGIPPPLTVRDRGSQPGPRISSVEEVTTGILRLGKAITDEAVLIANGAAYVALEGETRPPADIDLVISPEAHAYLRGQPDWVEAANGLLTNGVHEVGAGDWGSLPFEELKQRSWETPDGVKVASLSDVVSWKTWDRGEPKDLDDVQAIRNRLLDPTKPSLPNRVIKNEIEIARSCLPEHLQDDPDAQVAIELAANGLATVRALYGDDRIGRPNQIVGDLELPEYKVIATYHNGFGLPHDMGTLQRHMGNIGASDEQRLEALVGDSYADIAYGNGRKRDNPKGYDELRSANLLGAHAAMRGYDPAKVERLRTIVHGTGFDEQTGRQTGQHHPDPVVRGVAGIDLQILSEPESLLASHDIALEDGMSARFSPARTIGRAANELGARIGSTDEGMRFIDEHRDFRPSDTPEGPTVLEAFASRLVGNAGFHDPVIGYIPPDGWTLEDKVVRTEHAAKLGELGNRLLDGDITAQESRREADVHRQRLADRQ